MYRPFGLSRDPFAPVWDGPLFWESPERANLRKTALEALRAGRGVWLRGDEGTGREVLICRLAEDMAAEGACVLVGEEPAPLTGEAVLAGLIDASGAVRRGADVVALAEALYARLLEAFPESGPTVVAPAVVPLSVEALAEVQILAELRVAGSPVVVPILCGDGDAPVVGLREVRLPKPSPEDFRQCLVHRVAACGRPDLLSADKLDEVAVTANGLGDAVARARRELIRLAFVGPARLARRGNDVDGSPPS